MGRVAPEVAPAFRLDELIRAHRGSADIVRRTPVLTSASISERCGGTVALKAECLQRTGSFKLRGATNKVRSIVTSEGPSGGVVAGSAGNHAQSLAYAARRTGVPCEVFMPVDAPISKLAAVRAFGASVHQEDGSVDACVARARQHAADAGLAFVHPFDDEAVIAGQAGVGLELAEDVPDLRRVIVPVGGGGLASGVALALAQSRPEVEVIGVQAAACAPMAESIARGERVVAEVSQTIADGIAIKRPGTLTLPLLARLLHGIVTVDEDAIAEAMILLLERSKLLVEGAGAAALAALLSGAVEPAKSGTTAVVLSGGNVDISLFASIAAHEETRVGRRGRLFVRVSDRPGGLAGLLSAVARARASVLGVEHVRDGVPLAVRETGVILTIETQGPSHMERVRAGLDGAGYTIEDVE